MELKEKNIPKQLRYQFGELVLDVQDGVFTPTGTTEVLFKAVQKYIKKPGKILDLGCGCGVMGIALHQIGVVRGLLYASDLSEESVACTKKNADRYNCPVVAKSGALFDPWVEEKFDYIVDDVSGVSEEVARISPWFDGVPCESGRDGSSLVVQVIKKARAHLNSSGCLFFPIISFSNVNNILNAAHENFSNVELLAHEEWPLPKEMNQHVAILRKLHEEGYIQITEKFGMVLWFTDVYVAYNL
ncbi:hypothetical protein A2276_06080 [candidate division WOR-1 bacterium RIFOXYA12_FULL_43_27]|uniref:Methyltransferase small domain-containing protein n=1 Tax=candidate division WOR-1 bacterium RIFOXYC2_FULL_46_14 TaxID=1802587 RepID=A0A1F4U3J5_UNCSA|nr:MAG: hypothetical protein A2276_06080 [candidate division WOR-1 bacterium RIFOXYA12_FULL_43_27]OGC20226.1 MAG: hypothetical protein A2292_04080 [candidate division WOR-1 bacterium RIFOXYB2_FULL_46_45]OGC32035.1 MAG: hypothetical protein A2232_07365 [candidate division WOR-1 bacterium RIFOXYA2_FULL_46_56]OGC39437.1 MAG: hypothetical protein A2438_07730 [candidate division WOR-1 bacterium RIFOXYC2_FULL_46_14]